MKPPGKKTAAFSMGIMIGGNLVASGSMASLAREKFGVGEKDYSLEEIYMEYFHLQEIRT